MTRTDTRNNRNNRNNHNNCNNRIRDRNNENVLLLGALSCPREDIHNHGVSGDNYGGNMNVLSYSYHDTDANNGSNKKSSRRKNGGTKVIQRRGVGTTSTRNRAKFRRMGGRNKYNNVHDRNKGGRGEKVPNWRNNKNFVKQSKGRRRDRDITGNGTSRRNKVARGLPKSTLKLKPIHVSHNSIHCDWKKHLGGIIRYYINMKKEDADSEEDAMRHVERLYVQNQCSIEATRDAVLMEIGGESTMFEMDGINMNNFEPNNEPDDDDTVRISNSDTFTGYVIDTAGTGNSNHDNDNSNNNNNNHNSMIFDSNNKNEKNKTKIMEWIDLSMAIENSNGIGDAIEASNENYLTINKQGYILNKVERTGEGPAHSHEQWTNVIVPSWAIGKSYFFQVNNKSPVNLSCAMTIDGTSVARNVPIPAQSVRTIRPDNARYFETHQWVIAEAQKVGLQPHPNTQSKQVTSQSHLQSHSKQQQQQHKQQQQQQQQEKRYNGMRPNYKGTRVSAMEYPDPTNFGWTFTGSAEESYVEYFEKRLNLGLIKLDFYYTTATIKTILCHPTMGTNQLFRNTVDPNTYKNILQNPRAHTNMGYRYRHQRSTDKIPYIHTQSVKVEDNDNDNDLVAMETTTLETGKGTSSNEGVQNDDADMQIRNTNQHANSTKTTFFAKNDDYDFDTEGHFNRSSAMAKLQESNDFLVWEKAAQKEYSCIHAKFYVSLPKTKRRMFMHQQKKNIEKEALPSQATVVNIKAAEKATLGTKFCSTGPSLQSRKSSNVVMTKIKGINDDKDMSTAPIFEYKLYYRAESLLFDVDNLGDETYMSDDDQDDTIMKDDSQDIGDDDDDNIPLAEKLQDVNSIQDYKKEKSGQVEKWHIATTFAKEDEAIEIYSKFGSAISSASTIKDVDDLVEQYYKWFQKQQWEGKNIHGHKN